MKNDKAEEVVEKDDDYDPRNDLENDIGWQQDILGIKGVGNEK